MAQRAVTEHLDGLDLVRAGSSITWSEVQHAIPVATEPDRERQAAGEAVRSPEIRIELRDQRIAAHVVGVGDLGGGGSGVGLQITVRLRISASSSAPLALSSSPELTTYRREEFRLAR